MMVSGYLAFYLKLIDDKGYSQLSTLVVKILNPFLMISGVAGKRIAFSSDIINQNFILVCAFYTILFILGFIYIYLINCKDNRSYLYRMLILLPNVGFMGIPLVKEMLGAEYIVFVAFYILGFNLIAYTYGVYLSSKFGGKQSNLKMSKLINLGTVSAILSIIIFGYNIKLAVPFVSFVSYMGESCIVLSMVVVGCFLAKANLKEVLLNKLNIIFVITFMFIVPLLMVILSKYIPFDSKIIGVFQIMICMPIGSATCMFAQEYGGDGTEAAHLVAATTLATIITAPAVFYIASLL
jgi:hypothetical protein